MFMCRLIYLFTVSFFFHGGFFPLSYLFARHVCVCVRACDFSCIRSIEIIFQCLFGGCHNATTHIYAANKQIRRKILWIFFSVLSLSLSRVSFWFLLLLFFYVIIFATFACSKVKVFQSPNKIKSVFILRKKLV